MFSDNINGESYLIHSRGFSALSCIFIPMCILMMVMAFCLLVQMLGSTSISVNLMLLLMAVEAVALAATGSCVW